MRFTSYTRKAPEIERVTSKDKSRPILSHAHLNVEKSQLEATDSYMAVVHPVEIEEGDTSGLIPAEALKAFRKAGKYSSLAVNGEIELTTPDGVQSWKRPADGQFPNLEQIAPTEYSKFRIGLDPAKLLDLAKALGYDRQVTIEFSLTTNMHEEGEEIGAFPSNLRPMKITAGGDAWGILMPVRIP